jgi:hypothetical protein
VQPQVWIEHGGGELSRTAEKATGAEEPASAGTIIANIKKAQLVRAGPIICDDLGKSIALRGTKLPFVRRQIARTQALPQ